MASVDPRVIALVPVVMDLLNFEPNIKHHFKAYAGFWPSNIALFITVPLQVRRLVLGAGAVLEDEPDLLLRAPQVRQPRLHHRPVRLQVLYYNVLYCTVLYCTVLCRDKLVMPKLVINCGNDEFFNNDNARYW